MRPWKHTVVIGFSIGAGMVVALVLIAGGIYWYQNRPTPQKIWPSLDLGNVAVKLTTRWRDGALQYKFQATPLNPSSIVGTDRFRFDGWVVHFYDASGFESCRVDVSDHLGEIGGQFADGWHHLHLVAEGSTSQCSLRAYRGFQHWSVSSYLRSVLPPFIHGRTSMQ